MLQGPKIIILDKPFGYSSAFVTRQVGKILGAKKIGHMGTLDPFATGVLPIAVNEATRVIQYIKCDKKRYIFTIEFGTKTNTGDCTGQVVQRTQHIPTFCQLNEVLCDFIGEITQTPNAFSAVKIDGVRAYKLARCGVMPRISERKVKIFEICIVKQCGDNVFELDATVSPGTYIRSLCEDIAVKLGSLAFVKTLQRVSDGMFNVENANSIDAIAKKCYTYYDPEDVLDGIPVVFIGLQEKERLLHGLVVEKQAPRGIVLSKCGEFLAILQSTGDMLAVRRVIRFC